VTGRFEIVAGTKQEPRSANGEMDTSPGESRQVPRRVQFRPEATEAMSIQALGDQIKSAPRQGAIQAWPRNPGAFARALPRLKCLGAFSAEVCPHLPAPRCLHRQTNRQRFTFLVWISVTGDW
jgi:hypothetical protein